MEVFITRHVRKQRKAHDVEREIRKELIPILGKKPLAEVTRKNIATLIGEIRDRPAPRQAHNILRPCARFYSWLLSQPEYEDLVTVSPCDRIRAKDLIGETEDQTARALGRRAARRVAAAEASSYPYGPLKLLLLTAHAPRPKRADIRDWARSTSTQRCGRYRRSGTRATRSTSSRSAPRPSRSSPSCPRGRR